MFFEAYGCEAPLAEKKSLRCDSHSVAIYTNSRMNHGYLTEFSGLFIILSVGKQV